MRNICLNIEYDGTNFAGWQVQPDERTVQGEIEKALGEITKTKTKVIGAGRTDRGVHALNQYAHFTTKSKIGLDSLLNALNALTPDDILIKGCFEAENWFHSRFSALSRLYYYFICFRKSTIGRQYYCYIKHKPDIEIMRKLANFIKNKTDFKYWCHELPLKEDPERKKVADVIIFDIQWKEINEDLWLFSIKANRFLHGMVRFIVGASIYAGLGLFPEDEWETSFLDYHKVVRQAKAEPNGLYLAEIEYPEKSFINSYKIEGVGLCKFF